MNDAPPDRSLSVLLAQGVLLVAGIYFSVATVDTLLGGTSNLIGFGLYFALLLVLPVISFVAFLKKLPVTYRLSMLSLICLWGWILRAIWIWSASAPVGFWEMSMLFQTILFLLIALSVGIPILVTRLELERRSAEIPAGSSDGSRNAQMIDSPITFEDHFWGSKTESIEVPK